MPNIQRADADFQDFGNNKYVFKVKNLWLCIKFSENKDMKHKTLFQIQHLSQMKKK